MTENNNKTHEIIARFFLQQKTEGISKEVSLKEVESRGYERKFLEKLYEEIENQKTGTDLQPLAEGESNSQQILDELPLIPRHLEDIPKWQKQAIFSRISSVHRDISNGESKEAILQTLVEYDLSIEQAESLYQRVLDLHNVWIQNPQFPHSFLDFIQYYEKPVESEDSNLWLIVREYLLVTFAVMMMAFATLLDNPMMTIYFDFTLGAIVLVRILDKWSEQ